MRSHPKKVGLRAPSKFGLGAYGAEKLASEVPKEWRPGRSPYSSPPKAVPEYEPFSLGSFATEDSTAMRSRLYNFNNNYIKYLY